ncbi:hypothetical protein FOL47_000699 [Perkinsus chesapeaki]|uniref:Sugar phosphate transporter domain-containing protein n=1 Tax=Perkinsus chesapeaki TaxID=330153 RepID=A0A7J6MLF6_PERCH|nr:hypothetical protein FOL47_000699 [Perkinsus chesapeaki]
MIPICGGAIMCSGGEVNFNAIGVFFSIGAVITRALKNTMQAHLMTVSFSTIELLFVLAPANLFFFMAASIISEGPIEPIGNLLKSPGAFIAVIASSVLACSYNLLAFKMLQVLSPVGAMVVHTLKTPAMLLISFMLFGNQIGIMQIIGFIVITVGVHYYKKYGKEIKDDDYVVVGSSSPKGKRELDEFDLEGNHDAEVKSVSSDLDDSI